MSRPAPGPTLAALVLAFVIVPGALGQNLNQTYGSEWRCERLLPNAFFCQNPLYQGSAPCTTIFAACRSCETRSMDFFKTSADGGYCLARPSPSSAAPAQAPAASSTSTPSRPSSAQLGASAGALAGSIARLIDLDRESQREREAERERERERQQRLNDDKWERGMALRDTLQRQLSAEALPAQAKIGELIASAARPPAPTPGPAAAQREAPVTSPDLSRSEACRPSPAARDAEARSARGDRLEPEQVIELAFDMARRRDRGCFAAATGPVAGAAASSANPFRQRAANARPPGGSTAAPRPMPPPPELDPAAPDAGKASEDCLTLQRNFTVSGLGQCLRYMARNHPGQGQALMMDSIDRALERELGKEGLYGR